MSKQLKTLNHIKESREIEDLMKEHLSLGERYNAALAEYDKQDLSSYLKVDLKVRGMDRPTSKAMDEVSKNILSTFHNV